MIRTKIEHNKCKLGSTTAIGLMIEVTALELVQLAGPEPREAQAIVFVVDRSGSMSNGRLEMVKQTILDTLPRLNRADFVSVVSFDDTPFLEIPLTMVANLDMGRAVAVVNNLQTGGSTNIEGGYRLGLEEARKVGRGVKTNIILLSDGQANQGMKDPDQLAQLATRSLEFFVNTTTIGIGEGYDENILGALASGGMGNHVAALELAEAVDGLQREINDLLQMTMKDIEVTIQLGPEVSGRRSLVTAARRMAAFKRGHAAAKARHRNLASGEEVNMLFDLTVDAHPMTKQGSVPGVMVTVEYTNALTNERVTHTESFDFDLVNPHEWVEPVRDVDIQAELQEKRIAAVLDEAMELYMQGREDEADELIREAGESVAAFYADAKNRMSARSQGRMNETMNDLSSYSNMDDINIKRKRLMESRNRKMRDKRDFRDPNQGNN